LGVAIASCDVAFDACESLAWPIHFRDRQRVRSSLYPEMRINASVVLPGKPGLSFDDLPILADFSGPGPARTCA